MLSYFRLAFPEVRFAHDGFRAAPRDERGHYFSPIFLSCLCLRLKDMKMPPIPPTLLSLSKEMGGGSVLQWERTVFSLTQSASAIWETN